MCSCLLIVLIWFDQRIAVVSPLLGRYNVSNLLASLAIGHAKGYDIAVLLDHLSSFPGVPGRMERIDSGQAFNVLVDYAHTDDALKNACEMLREITPGKLIVVCGCGGDRDHGHAHHDDRDDDVPKAHQVSFALL